MVTTYNYKLNCWYNIERFSSPGVGDVHPNLVGEILTQIKLYDRFVSSWYLFRVPESWPVFIDIVCLK